MPVKKAALLKEYAFFFHYNKPETVRRGKVTITLHYRGTCYMVDNVHCLVPCEGRIRKSAPRFVMAGKAACMNLEEGVATLSDWGFV